MTTTNHTPPHQPAGKDPTAVRAALKTMREQYVAILRNYGANNAQCEYVRNAMEAVTDGAMFEVELNAN